MALASELRGYTDLEIRLAYDLWYTRIMVRSILADLVSGTVHVKTLTWGLEHTVEDLETWAREHAAGPLAVYHARRREAAMCPQSPNYRGGGCPICDHPLGTPRGAPVPSTGEEGAQ